MKLIIAEKPSLARNIVSSIGGLKRRDGYFEGAEYIVTWAFGHLFSLADIEYYSPNPDGSTRWTTENIPCFPKKFVFELKRDKAKNIDPGVAKQFNIIKTLCLRNDVDTVVNAGDSDREGEIIVRLCVINSFGDGEMPKTFKRLWLPDQTSETISAALADMKDEEHYNSLADEGFARTYIDWLYGVNLTRYATLKSGSFLRVGRVIVPIVKAIYDRDMQIKNFVPDIYYAISSSEVTGGEKVELTSKTKFDKKDYKKALELCDKYNAAQAIVTGKKRKKDTLNPPKLYSLTKLQNVLGKKYKMPMEQSLNILQSLYERGYVTYPRTNSEYLAEAEQNKIKNIISVFAKIGYPLEFKHKKTIFDDSKIESHSALTPTHKVPQKTDLTEDEYKVYGTVVRRFAAVFCAEEAIAEKAEIKIDVGGMEEFTLKGSVIVVPGWTKYDDYTKKDKILPNINNGDTVNICFKPVEKQTSPPKHYTIETLNNYLKNPFKDDKANAESEDDAEEYRAVFEGLELGTEATRTGIIDNARKSGYINLKKDVYTILPDGEKLINSLERMNISMDKYKTAELGKSLKAVYHGKMTVDDSINLAKKEIGEVFNQTQMPPETDTDDGFVGDIIGKCPYCANDFVRTVFGYGCLGYKGGCKFAISNIICGRVISKENVKHLLNSGSTYKIRGFTSPRTGKKFDACLAIDKDNKYKTVFKF